MSRNDERADVNDVYELLLHMSNQQGRPSVFRKPELMDLTAVNKPPWLMQDKECPALKGWGDTPAEAAIAFDLAWTTGKAEEFSSAKEVNPPRKELHD
jgi:hypothetical protein